VREQRAVFKEFHALETKICPFKNLPRHAAVNGERD
jgi:hypothetical protein